MSNSKEHIKLLTEMLALKLQLGAGRLEKSHLIKKQRQAIRSIKLSIKLSSVQSSELSRLQKEKQ